MASPLSDLRSSATGRLSDRHSLISEAGPRPVKLGIYDNAAQFGLLVVVNALVGAVVGQERALVPLLGSEIFGLDAGVSLLTFIAAFGVTKAISNFAAGVLCDRIGRRKVLLGGWLMGVPVPLILMFAPSWSWVIVANLLLGLNQGLAWSATVIMKIDLAGPRQRGLAMGLNEFAGYFAVAITASLTGFLASRFGLRPVPFLFGAAVVALGLGGSALFVRETTEHARLESFLARPTSEEPQSLARVLARVSYQDAGLAAASRTGLVNNANDAAVWGLLPLVLAAEGMGPSEIGLIAGIYPAVWGLSQLGFGALSDRVGRRWLISTGMWAQAAALVWLVLGSGKPPRIGAAVLLGLGTGLVYPSLLAAVGDLAPPSWRARALGGYRLWRDFGFVAGALLAGLAADVGGGPATAILAFAALTAVSGLDAALNIEDGGPRQDYKGHDS